MDVFAAASLTEAFEELATNYGGRIRFNFGASSDLARAIADGSTADVFAAADEPSMRTALEAGEAKVAETFSTNKMTIAVPIGNPEGISGLDDLVGLSVALCAPEVPCGAYAAEVLDKAHVTLAPDSLEPDVKAVVTRVALGEVDAGIVYSTDVRRDDVSQVVIPEDHNIVARYKIAVVGDDDDADQFLKFVLSHEGQSILRRYGFGPP